MAIICDVSSDAKPQQGVFIAFRLRIGSLLFVHTPYTMWIAHFAPGLAFKRMAPDVPLAFLALAGALPDALFMVFAILGMLSHTIFY